MTHAFMDTKPRIMLTWMCRNLTDRNQNNNLSLVLSLPANMVAGHSFATWRWESSWMGLWWHHNQQPWWSSAGQHTCKPRYAPGNSRGSQQKSPSLAGNHKTCPFLDLCLYALNPSCTMKIRFSSASGFRYCLGWFVLLFSLTLAVRQLISAASIRGGYSLQIQSDSRSNEG